MMPTESPYWRECIADIVIHSGCDGEGMDSDDYCEFMMAYFSPTCFTDFKSGPHGFYDVYGTVFSEIEKKEKIADKTIHFPSFGSEMDDFERVLAFYRVWSCFSTRRSFAAVDTYNPNEVSVSARCDD